MTIFKVGNFEEELITSMQRSLLSSQLDNKLSLDKLSKAADYINTAAELLDDSGLRVEAEMLTKVLEKIAMQYSSDKVFDDLRSPEEIETLLKPDYSEDIVMDPLVEEEIIPDTIREYPVDVDMPVKIDYASIIAEMTVKRAAKKINKKKV